MFLALRSINRFLKVIVTVILPYHRYYISFLVSPFTTPFKGKWFKIHTRFFFIFSQFLIDSIQNHRIPDDISLFRFFFHFPCNSIAQWVENVEFLTFLKSPKNHFMDLEYIDSDNLT